MSDTEFIEVLLKKNPRCTIYIMGVIVGDIGHVGMTSYR